MERQGMKVFFAVALGVAIGVLVGRALHPVIGWIVGAMVGGVVGYLTVAPIAAIRAIPQAWRTVVDRWPSAAFWECSRWTMYAMVNLLIVVMLSFVSVLFVCGERVKEGWFEFALGGLFGSCTILIVATTLPFLTMAFLNQFYIPHYDNVHRRKLESYTKDARKLAIALSPPVALCYWLPRGLWWFATCGISASARFTAHLAVAWFWIMHSDLRLLCLTDAFLFAGLGTIFGGHVLAWAIVGGAFGVLNYEVVSKRVLKLVPVAIRKDE